MSDEDYAR
jgi:hypothetical protein